MTEIYIDQQRRLAMKSILVIPSILMCPRLAEAAIDPISVTIITSLIQAVGQVLASRLAAEASSTQSERAENDTAFLKDFRREHTFSKEKFLAGDMSVDQEIACTRQGQPDSLLIEKNLDKLGTDFGLEKGHLNIRRQSFQGGISLAEAGVLSAGMARAKTMPVPVGPYSAPSRSEYSKLHDNNINLGQDDAVFALRRYSSARNPTVDGWDLATVLYANSENRRVGSKVVLRSNLVA